MHNRQPTMRSRELGEGLRRAMEAAGLTGVEAARRLDWSPSRVSRMLSGTRGTTEVDVAMFLTVCGVRGRERKRLLAVCQDQGVPGWLQEYGDRLPKQLITLVGTVHRGGRSAAGTAPQAVRPAGRVRSGRGRSSGRRRARW
jgi:transcriptional regulator with XRE-family HTH domain